MPAPRSSSGSGLNANMIKIIVAIVALVFAGGLLAWQMGLFSSGPVITPAQKAALEKQDAEIEAAKKAAPPPANKPAGTDKKIES